MMATHLRRIVLVLLGAIVLVIALVAVNKRDPVPQVVTESVTRQSLNAGISSNGKVEPIEPHTLRAQLTTFVRKVLATEGQAVSQGQVLLTLDRVQLSAQLTRSKEELVSAGEQLRVARGGGNAVEQAQIESDQRKIEAELTKLRRERDALARLFSKQAATQDEIDQNKLALERAETERQLLQRRKEEMARRAGIDVDRALLVSQRARAEASALEEKVSSARVTAPIDGTLYSLPVRTSDFVREGDVLAEMADLRRVRVRAFVDEPDLGWLERGQMVEITWDAAPNRTWTGQTDTIPRQVVGRGSRSVGEVLCSVENEGLELLPNVNVLVRIRVRERADALVVPRAAVRAEGSQRFVFVVEGGRLRKRGVKVGIASATMYEVLEGLGENERVALPGDVELRDKLEVRTVERK